MPHSTRARTYLVLPRTFSVGAQTLYTDERFIRLQNCPKFHSGNWEQTERVDRSAPSFGHGRITVWQFPTGNARSLLR